MHWLRQGKQKSQLHLYHRPGPVLREVHIRDIQEVLPEVWQERRLLREPHKRGRLPRT